MIVELYPPLGFSELGQRENNEDYIFPAIDKSNSQTALFLVCDGMGGLDKGELASRLVTETIANSLLHGKGDELNDYVIREVIEEAHLALELELNNDPLITRLGSTLTLLAWDYKGAIIAHIGDSRVYHIRNGTILYKTKDHKQVLDMIEKGIIDAEQAKTHPWRNRLSRSISVQSHINNDKPRTKKFHEPEIHFIQDVRANDYFFMCTDGVLEQIDDDNLIKTLEPLEIDNYSKLNSILALCEEKTKDNYSGYLIQVKKVISSEFATIKKINNSTKKNDREFKNYLFVALLFLYAAIIWSAYKYLVE